MRLRSIQIPLGLFVKVAAAAGLLAGPGAAPARAQTVEWIRQLGGTFTDVSYGVSADQLGNIYITGYSHSDLDGTKVGEPWDSDAYVAKYDAAGVLQWTRLLGTTSGEYSHGVSADGLGNVYISGVTGGSLDGPNVGSTDAFVAKYDAAGSLLWTRQLGTSSADSGRGVSADGLGNVYITGWTPGSLGGPLSGSGGTFVAKYDATGVFQWTRQLGTASALAVSADGLGNVYISGGTEGSLDGPNAGNTDAFVAKYDAAGDLQWTRQLGTTGYDFSHDVSADGLGNIYISGTTGGSLGGPSVGGNNAFVAKYDAAGSLQWTRQLGANGEEGRGVSADGLGNVYITGQTSGSLGGPHAGRGDAFVSKYNADGVFQWTRQLGTSEYDFSYGVSTDGLGNVYFSGETLGNLGGPNLGNRSDAFLVKLFDPAAAANLPGDFNHDGVVDGGDFLAWQQGLGAAYDAADLNDWRQNFGATTAGAAAGAPFSSPYAPAPEPSMLALAGPALALLAAAARGRVSPRLAPAVSEKLPNCCRVSPRLGNSRLARDAAK